MEASHRPKQAQHFSIRRKVQNGNPRVHQDLPHSRAMGIVDRLVRRLPTHPHPSKLKEIPKVLLQVSGVPVHLPCKGSETNGPLQWTQTSPIPGLRDFKDWLIRSQSQEEAQVNTQAVVDLTQSLGWIINQKKNKKTETYSSVFRSWATNTI